MRFFRFNDFNNNLEALVNLQDMIGDFFGEHSPYYRNEWLTNRNVFPAANIFEKGDDHLVVKCELPGMNKEDIEITIKDKMLTISGKRDILKDKDPKTYSYHRRERADGKFNRTFELPYIVKHDNTEAEYSNGILTISLEKADIAKSRKISIS